MATYTTFCFGTGESQTMAKKNIISQFSEACTSPNSVIDGPGMLGREVSANTTRATEEILEWLTNQDSLVNNINLTGFSRGAVTCIRIANQLQSYQSFLQSHQHQLSDEEAQLLAKLENINIHIFANDPVAGMTDKRVIEGRVIPSNVKQYVAVLQMDEMRRDFKPQDMTRAIIASPTTEVSMLPMYGNHSDCTKIKNDDMQKGPALIWHAMASFLSQHGTTFKDNKPPSLIAGSMDATPLPVMANPHDLLEQFAEFHQERPAYLASGEKIKLLDGMPVPRKQRSLNRHHQYYVKGEEFFINQLERELFKVSYPQVFNYFFEQNINDPRFPRHYQDEEGHRQEVARQLLQLREQNPVLFERLMESGYINIAANQQLMLAMPQGVYCLEPMTTLQQIFPEHVPLGIELLSQDYKALAQLESDVYRLTFQYQREKSNATPTLGRRLSSRAEDLRQGVKAIIESKASSEEVLNEPEASQYKHEQVIRFVGSHYQQLVKSNHQSELRDMLKALLEQHGYHYRVSYHGSFLQSALADTLKGLMTFIKEVLSFTLNLGYVGGIVFSGIGTFVEDIGSRLMHLTGGFGTNIALNVVKAPFILIAKLLEGVGFIIKNSFGLKPLAKFIDDGLRDLRDATVSAIDGFSVERIEPDEHQDASAKFQQARAALEALRNQDLEMDEDVVLSEAKIAEIPQNTRF